jgi:hypothetical protein
VSYLFWLRDWGSSDASTGRDRIRGPVGLLLRNGRPCAITLNTRTSCLSAHSRAFHVFSTLRAISENNLSYVMYTVSLDPTSSLLTHLAGTTGISPPPISRRRSSPARSSWPPRRTGAALAKSPSLCGGDASAWTAKTDTARCSLQRFWELLRTLCGLKPRPALRARREPGPRSHPHVRPRRRLRRVHIPAMLRTRRSSTCAPTSSRSRPTPPWAPTRRSWSAATSRTCIATATYVAGPYALAATC